MMLRLAVDELRFTVAGSFGDVTVYDENGKPLRCGIRWTPEARDWIAGYIESLPPRQPRRP